MSRLTEKVAKCRETMAATGAATGNVAVPVTEADAIQRLYDAAVKTRPYVYHAGPTTKNCPACAIEVALDALRDLCGEEA